MMTSGLRGYQKTSFKVSVWFHWIPLHQNLIYWPYPTAFLKQFLRAIWGAASWAAVLILPQIKLNLQKKKKIQKFVSHWLNVSHMATPDCKLLPYGRWTAWVLVGSWYLLMAQVEIGDGGWDSALNNKVNIWRWFMNQSRKYSAVFSCSVMSNSLWPHGL